jgi:hypothetical protein
LSPGSRSPPETSKGITLVDWLWSTAFYGSAMLFLVGAIGIVRPFKRLHRRSRRRAGAIALAGAIFILAIARGSVPGSRTSGESVSSLETFMPAYHFREQHEIVVKAPPARVFEAVKATSADEIALFNLFTSIRRFGRPGPESILNAPGRQPLLDVAVRSGFLWLEDAAPREAIVGAIVVGPPGARRPAKFTADDFKQFRTPGFALAAMNFRIEGIDAGSSRLFTETRVFATDDVALGRFTPYWRIIFPGSSILRATWLRAIKTRAEKSTS